MPRTPFGVYDQGRAGFILVGTVRLYEVFTDRSQPASELDQLWSRVGICELLPGLTDYEGRQMSSHGLGRLPEPTIKQVLAQTGSSIRRLATLFEHLKELRAQCRPRHHRRRWSNARAPLAVSLAGPFRPRSAGAGRAASQFFKPRTV